jgi:hypothetical protein
MCYLELACLNQLTGKQVSICYPVLASDIET